jgi:hypothetical protein
MANIANTGCGCGGHTEDKAHDDCSCNKKKHFYYYLTGVVALVVVGYYWTTIKGWFSK